MKKEQSYGKGTGEEGRKAKGKNDCTLQILKVVTPMVETVNYY
jgi:hypothetical protein